MKSIAILFICLSLSGCFSQSVDQADINKASSYCGSSKNISQMESTFFGLRVYCFDKVGVWGDEIQGTKND